MAEYNPLEKGIYELCKKEERRLCQKYGVTDIEAVIATQKKIIKDFYNKAGYQNRVYSDHHEDNTP